MKIGKLASTNSKGQFVIPREYREMFEITPRMTLNISPKYNGLFIEPIRDVISNVNVKDVLLSTKGSWGKESVEAREKKQLELEASENRKQGW